MDASQINKVTDLVHLIGGRLTKAGGYHQGPCPFCGGKDRFTIKHTQDGDRWHCRRCGDGKYHTAIDYIMKRDQADFKTACKILTGESPEPTREYAKPKAKLISRPIVLPASEWQAKAFKHIDTASDYLLESKNGQVGREYLAGRGINRAVWLAWHLGFSMIWDPRAGRKRPSIVIPWMDMDARRDVISAVKYRFIDQDPNGLRYISMAGSLPLLFGLWDVVDLDNTLLLVEGEMNALSIWQCRPQNVSVLSIGSESSGRVDILKTMARHYRRVFFWMDDPEKGKEMRKNFGSAIALQSPVWDGVKWDANNMLKAGKLSNLLSRFLDVVCAANFEVLGSDSIPRSDTPA